MNYWLIWNIDIRVDVHLFNRIGLIIYLVTINSFRYTLKQETRHIFTLVYHYQNFRMKFRSPLMKVFFHFISLLMILKELLMS